MDDRLQKKLFGHLGRAIADFDMIADGDRIMVGISGGKDSYTLLDLLLGLQKRAPVRFSLVAVNLDQGHPGFPAHLIEEHLERLGVEYRMLKKDTYTLVKQVIPEGKTYCPACSRFRRGILYNTAVELGATKIALGHHRDDLIETLLLSALFSGALKTMPPKLRSKDGRNTVIRPLCYAPEEEIAEYARLKEFPIVPCDLCGSQENLQRRKVKQLLKDLSTEHPDVKGNLLHALGNVIPSHLLDQRLYGLKEEAREDDPYLPGEEVSGCASSGPVLAPAFLRG